MPWTVEDVDKHKKGLTDKQKKQWVRIANTVLSKCLAKGGTDETCAPSAIKQANGVIANNSENYKSYKSKQEDAYDVELKVHQGKPHMIVPVTMMVEGVHNGSHGPIFHSIAELGKFPASWNGIPVAIDHPEEEGQSISANSPEVIDTRTVGRIYSTNVDGKKLKANVWLDEDKLFEIAPSIHADILAGKVLEISLGLFSDEEETPGEWEGEHYDAIAVNHRPDHLAILTECAGACSVADGCGLGVNAQVTDMASKRKALGMSLAEFYAIPGKDDSDSHLPIFDEAHVRAAMSRFNQVQGVSAEQKKSAHTKIAAKAKHYGIDITNFKEDIHSSQNTGKAGSGDNDNNSNNFKKEDKMSENKCPECVKKIDALIANKESGFVETDREMLNTLTAPQLDKLTPKVVEKIVEKPVEVNKLTPEQTADLAFLAKQRAEAKSKMIQSIQANTSKELWPDAALNGMDEDTLKRVFDSVKKEDVHDYSIAGGGVIQSNAGEIEPLAPTGIVFETAKK